MKEFLLLLAMFWNVENFFDTKNDPNTADDEFTPKGDNHWTWKKFEKKKNDIAKTIMLVADRYGELPALIGLAEVENMYVLQKLIRETPLARAGYKIIHDESPDNRGIDVALLYREDIFTPEKKRFMEVGFPTRELLYVKGTVKGLDTLHVLVNHWPSKGGGEKETLPKRMAVSNKVKEVTDSILTENSRANILLMGDFNDVPTSEPIENLENFANLAHWAKGGKGTYKYKGEWEFIDQFLVSGNMLPPTPENPLKWMYCHREMDIFMHEWLVTPDESYMGVKPNRTLVGPKYNGGVSDHLPIVLKIYGAQE